MFSTLTMYIIHQIHICLDQVVQSDDEIYFENDVRIDLRVIGTRTAEGRESIHSNEVCINNLNRYCRQAFLNLIQEGQNFRILKFIKRGLIDIDCILINETKNECLLLSVLTGVIFEQQNKDLKCFFKYLKSNFKSSKLLKESLFTTFNVKQKDLESKNQAEILEYLSSKLKRRICLFAAKDGINANYQITYVTRTVYYKKAIKIVLMYDHCYFLFTTSNIEKKGFEFCNYCCKSFSNIKLHKCIIEKCASCLRYVKSMKETDIRTFCITDKNYESPICSNCNKSFKSAECLSIHKKFSLTYCKSTKLCFQCKKIHQDKKHNCEVPFCQKCFSHHKPTMFCRLKVNSKKNLQNKTFLTHLSLISDKIQILYLINLTGLKFEDENFIVYEFFSNEAFYREKRFMQQNLISEKKIHYQKQDSFSLSNILLFFCECQNNCKCKFTVICSNLSFKDLINLEENISNYKIFQREKDIYKMQSKSITVVSAYEYFQLEDFELCLYLNQNPYHYFMDSILEVQELDSKIGCLSIDYFLNKIHFSDKSIIKLFYEFQPYLTTIQNSTKENMIQEKSINVLFVLLFGFKKLFNIFVNIFPGEFDFDIIFSSSSMVELFYNQLLLTINGSNLPALPSYRPGNLKNTSRHELYLSEIIKDAHLKIFPTHNLLSLVNAEGNQKKIGKLSADIFCQECNTAIFVEGSFKYICNTHIDKNVSDKKKLLDKFGKLKRDKFCELLGVNECFVIATCCIENGIYSEEFKSSSFFDLKLLENPKNSIKNFSFNFYQKLDFQDAILSPINFPILTAFKSYKYPIQKFDIEAAFLSVFQNEQFVLPSSNDAIRLVGAEAQKYFNQVDLQKQFVVVRALILPNVNFDFQVVPLKSRNKILTYKYFCKKCSLNGIENKIMACNHSKYEKGFYITCYGFDLKFYHRLNYYFEVCELVSFPAAHNTKLHKVVNNFKEFKKNTLCCLEKKLSKRAALCCLGRSALNIRKYDKLDNKYSTNASEIGFFMQSNAVKSFHIFNNNILFSTKSKENQNTYKSYLESCSKNTCSVLFGSANNFIRNLMIETYLFSKHNLSKHSKILRFSVDCIFIYLDSKMDRILLYNYFKNTGFNFKLEAQLKELYNHKKAGYIMKYIDNDIVLRIPGVSLSVLSRINLDVKFESLLKGYKFLTVKQNRYHFYYDI